MKGQANMKLTGAQIKARLILRRAPDHTITSAGGTGVRRQTIEALARAGLVEVERTNVNREVRHRSGRTSIKASVAWKATLLPRLPSAEQMEELDLIIRNGEGILREDRRAHAAAYIARTTPDVALDGSPARSPQYNEATAYAECLKWPTAKLLDHVMMLRAMTGQTAQIPEQRTLSDRTDVWVLFSKNPDGTPGKELGRVRASTQNQAALVGNSLLNTRGGYSMRRLHTPELGRWVEDFRARGLVLRLEGTHDGYFRVVIVADGEVLVTRTTGAEAKRDALADLTSLYAALPPAPTPDPIPADQEAEQ